MEVSALRSVLGSPAVLFSFVAALAVFTLSEVIASGLGEPSGDADFRNLIAFIVSMVWMVANFAQIAVPDYTVNVYIHWLMVVTAAYLFGAKTEIAAVLLGRAEMLKQRRQRKKEK